LGCLEQACPARPGMTCKRASFWNAFSKMTFFHCTSQGKEEKKKGKEEMKRGNEEKEKKRRKRKRKRRKRKRKGGKEKGKKKNGGGLATPVRAGSRGGAPGRQVSPRLPHARPFTREKRRRGRQPGGQGARKKTPGY